MDRCEKCGAPLIPGALFCENCGAKVSLEKVPAQRSPQYRQPEAGSGEKASKSPVIVKILLIIIVVGLIVFLAAKAFGGKKPSGTENKDKVQTKISQSQKNQLESKDAEPAHEGQRQMHPSDGEPSGYSTAETPSPEDFTWFTDKAGDWTFGDIPEGVRLLEASDLSGSWKAMEMIRDYDGAVIYKYFTVTMTPEASNISAEIKGHYMDAEGETEDISWDSESLKGAYSIEGLALGQPGNMFQALLYESGGKQYGEGILSVQSGEEIRVALVRP